MNLYELKSNILFKKYQELNRQLMLLDFGNPFREKIYEKLIRLNSYDRCLLTAQKEYKIPESLRNSLFERFWEIFNTYFDNDLEPTSFYTDILFELGKK